MWNDTNIWGIALFNGYLGITRDEFVKDYLGSTPGTGGREQNIEV